MYNECGSVTNSVNANMSCTSDRSITGLRTSVSSVAEYYQSMCFAGQVHVDLFCVLCKLLYMNIEASFIAFSFFI